MRGWYFHCPSHHFVLNVSTLPRPFPCPKELENQFSILLEASLCSQWQEFQVVITINTTTRGEVLPGLLVTMKGQSLHAQIGWWLGELFCFWRLLLFTASTIWTLTCWTLDTSTGTAEPPPHPWSQHSNIYSLSTFIIYILNLGCLVSAKLVALWLLCEKNRFGLPHLASVARSLVARLEVGGRKCTGSGGCVRVV